MEPLGKVLIFSGLLIALVGAGLLLLPRAPWVGRLPGDIHISRDGFSFHFPVVTCIVLSIVLSVILTLIFRNR